MSKKTNQIMAASLLIGLLLLLFIYNSFKKKNNIETHPKLIVGTIYKVHIGARGGVEYDYKFYFDNKVYEGGGKIFISSSYMNLLLNKKFPILIDSLEPTNSEILISKYHFDRYDYEFPDSLEWVEKLVKESL